MLHNNSRWLLYASKPAHRRLGIVGALTSEPIHLICCETYHSPRWQFQKKLVEFYDGSVYRYYVLNQQAESE